MNRPAIMHRPVMEQPSRHAHKVQELAAIVVALLAVAALLLTTSGSARFLG